MHKKVNKLKKDTVLSNERDRQGKQRRRRRDGDKSKKSIMAYAYKNGVVKPTTFYTYVRPYFKKKCLFLLLILSHTL